jgi:hypothetical protein
MGVVSVGCAARFGNGLTYNERAAESNDDTRRYAGKDFEFAN